MHTCLDPALPQELRKPLPLLICWQHNGQQDQNTDQFLAQKIVAPNGIGRWQGQAKGQERRH